MRFTSAFILGIAVVSTSDSLVGRALEVPACYTDCVSLADTSGCPSATAIACLCNDKTYLSQVEKCVQATCQGANLADAVSIGQTVCLEAGVTLSASTASPTSVKAAAIHLANLNSFAIGLATVGLVALAIY